MSDLYVVSADKAGILIWVLWALIGAFEALFLSRTIGSRRMLLFDLIVGVVCAVLGGYSSTQFLGDTPTQMFLLSILLAVLGGAVGLWITGALFYHFSEEDADAEEKQR